MMVTVVPRWAIIRTVIGLPGSGGRHCGPGRPAEGTAYDRPLSSTHLGPYVGPETAPQGPAQRGVQTVAAR
jgi:hypothetical protein